MAVMPGFMDEQDRAVQSRRRLAEKTPNLNGLDAFYGGAGEACHMYQLVYISSVTPGQSLSVDDILTVSRRNNARDAITGLLYADRQRFLQALEGPQEQVLKTMARISADPRHRAIVVLSRRTIAMREFGGWAMASQMHGDDAAMIAQVGRLVAHASPNVRATFESFCKLRRPTGAVAA
jgi:hypothetical protein